MRNIPVFDWKATVSANGSAIMDVDFPVMGQDKPFDAKELFTQFCESFEETLQLCRDKRFEATGIASKIGPDIHGKPAIEVSDRVGGQCYVLFVFASEEAYKDVAVGDTVTCRGNYLGVTNEFGVVMKRSELVKEDPTVTEPLTFYPKHPAPLKTHKIETKPMPILPQDAPFDVKTLVDAFKADLNGALAIYEDKRFEITGVAVKVGPDIHNKPSIEISDRVGGQTYALTIFPTDDHYSKVSVGDKVTVRGNYLVFCNWFGVVTKYSELVSVEKAHG